MNTPLTEFGLGFSGSSDRYGVVAVWPIWLLVVVVAMCAGASYGNYRFSLRTLLITTTLVAVVLGVIMIAMRWPAG